MLGVGCVNSGCFGVYYLCWFAFAGLLGGVRWRCSFVWWFGVLWIVACGIVVVAASWVVFVAGGVWLRYWSVWLVVLRFMMWFVWVGLSCCVYGAWFDCWFTVDSVNSVDFCFLFSFVIICVVDCSLFLGKGCADFCMFALAVWGVYVVYGCCFGVSACVVLFIGWCGCFWALSVIVVCFGLA